MAAKKLRDIGTGCPIVVDKMDNQANAVYLRLYERLYIILNNVVVYAGDSGPYGGLLKCTTVWKAIYERSKN